MRLYIRILSLQHCGIILTQAVIPTTYYLELRDNSMINGLGQNQVIGSTLVEKNQRLSRSHLWQLHSDFYRQSGISAWTQGHVPHYITNNPMIANAYAQLVLNFLTALPIQDESKPIYILEIGAGSGRFAFHFLKLFNTLIKNTPLAKQKIVYLLTDLAESNVAFWKEHPCLQPYLQSGQLDLAMFDPSNDLEINLVISGNCLTKQDFVNPEVIIANYFFDSLPCDVFSIRNGILCEELVSLYTGHNQHANDDLESLSSVEIRFEPHFISTNYYSRADYNQILRLYQHTPNNLYFTFPIDALQSVWNLLQISSEQTLLISADKGNYQLDLQYTTTEPEISLHGKAISMMVNYHALAECIKLNDGKTLQSKHREEGLVFSVFLTNTANPAFIQLQNAFNQVIETASPDDFFVLKRTMQQHYNSMTLEQLLAFVRLSLYDPQIFRDMLPVLIGLSQNMPDNKHENLYQVAQRVWDLFFPIGEPINLYHLLARLFITLSRYKEAYDCLQASQCFFGTSLEYQEILGLIPDHSKGSNSYKN